MKQGRKINNNIEKDPTSKYDLTQEEYEEALKMAELSIFMDCGRSEEPISVFIASQPGGGKTGLRFFVEKEYGFMNFAEFDPDEIAVYHKYYHEILEEFPKESYKILQRFVRPALDTYLRKRAVQLKTNIMQEGTLAATQGYIDILNFQKHGGVANLGDRKEEIEIAGGYKIDINVLAVHRYESLLSSYEREQSFIEKGLPPRAVTAENHDRAYNNMVETIKIIEEKKLYDRIRVFRRGKKEGEPEKVFETGDDKYPSVTEAILQERNKNKKEILENAQNYLARIQQLLARIQKNENKANAEIQVKKIEQLKAEFLAELEKRENNQEQSL